MTSRWLTYSFGVLFAIAHTQSPLYYSNQNQYFLHGYAEARFGDLERDWLTSTVDPTPVFTFIVSLGVFPVGVWLFQEIFFAGLVVYFVALWRIFESLRQANGLSAQLSAWAALIVIHAGISRWASDRLLGVDYPWFLQCGVANQYILGPGLQPSVVGVGLVVAVAAYARGRVIVAAGLAAAVNGIHATYLLPAAMLVAGFLAGELMAARWGKASLGAIVALLIAGAAAAVQYERFHPTSPEIFETAQRILADVRIPHHARAGRWFDGIAALQTGWLILGIALTRGSRLFVPLATTASLGILASVVTIASGQPTLELLFPWRVSSVLMPIATAVIVGRLSVWSARKLPSKFLISLAVIGTLAAVVGAAFVYGERLGYREPAAEDPVLAFVRDSAMPGELYLIPARFPKPTSVRGVSALTFAPPPKPDATVYFELARFRLATGAALYIDFKAIPYRDVEVLEWHRRVSNAERWFATPDWDASGVIDEVAQAGITHVVMPTKQPVHSTRLEQVFTSPAYQVLRVKQDSR